MKQEKRESLGVRVLVALVAMSLLGSGAVLAQAQRTGGTQVQGMQVAIDPATGTLRQPTAAEAKALSDAFRSMISHSGLTEGEIVQSADGTMIVTAGPEFLNIWLAAVDGNGSLAQACVEGQETAANYTLSGGTWEEK